jgi:hypothetical protein
MATNVRTFDLYNTNFYWKGYSVTGFETQVSVAQAYYIAQYSSNPIGSQIDFFTLLAGISSNNPVLSLSGTTINSLPYFWGKYWWDEAIYYSNSLVLSAISQVAPLYYQPFSESVGSLAYISYMNNQSNVNSVPYNTIIDRLLPAGISDTVKSFYKTANTLFVNNISNIGPVGTDVNPNNSNLIMADTDLSRIVNANSALITNINSLYPVLNRFLPFNNTVIGNLIVPYNWSTQIEYEDTTTIGDTTVTVDLTNTTTGNQVQLTMAAITV